ncbi:hypothetical protein B0H13DRAFT_2027723 [Mycena leptocephala]|nr:hypothetical protein B0H13DRAFT_2027723 [Mycena leptocephala]
MVDKGNCGSNVPATIYSDLARERYGIDRRLILERIHLCGLNTRMLLFDFYVPTLQTVEASITEALRAGNLFSFSAIDASQPVHRVFMIKPLVVINESSKRACLQRSDYSAEFLSAHIAQMTVKLAQDQFERVQHQLAIALNISITRSVAGKVVEGLMHRGFVKGMQLPAVFNTGTGTVTIKRTVELIGKAESFTCEPEPSKTDDDLKFPRPLYLRPRPSTTNFAAAVDAIVVTDTKLGFIQTSLAPHSGWNFWMMLRIMARLRHWHGAQVDVSRLQDVIYCLVGTDPDPKRLRELVAGASQTLAELKKLNSEELSKEFGMRHSKIAHARLARFRVVGYTFDPGRGFGRFYGFSCDCKLRRLQSGDYSSGELENGPGFQDSTTTLTVSQCSVSIIPESWRISRPAKSVCGAVEASDGSLFVVSG